jgi:hypothetical protein
MSSVGKEMSYGLDALGSLLGKANRFLRSVQTGSEANSAFYLMGTVGSFPALIAAELEADVPI